MWIRCSNESTTRLFIREIMDEPVEFKNGRARVTQEVGEALAERYEAVSVSERETEQED